ncbi:MAG TPA: response regulator [Candidatus Deferrimicrobium sp.]|nr:response regulator [Candidatus Deferrimicrobium sp.]
MSNDKPKLAWYENNEDFTDPIKEYLSKYFLVKIFGMPENAEEEIAQFQPQLTVFDYRMPMISGLEMYERLKKRGLKFIPVFFTIWASDDSTKQLIIAAGIKEEAIMDKSMDCESFAKKAFSYYENLSKSKEEF